jgi:hypothetical protein
MYSWLMFLAPFGAKDGRSDEVFGAKMMTAGNLGSALGPGPHTRELDKVTQHRLSALSKANMML